MNTTLLIFDLDGTILNTIDDLADSVNHVCQNNGYPCHSVDEIKFMVGNGIPKLIHRALPQNTKETEYEKILSQFIEYYDNHCAIKTKPYEGILELLSTLKNQGAKLAVNSNKLDAASNALCNQYFNGIFDYVFGNQPGFNVKPSPEGVHEILKHLNISEKAKIVFIGDSDVDFQTAQNAEIDFIGCDWGFRGEDFLKNHGAKKIAKKPADILFFLNNQQK